MLDLHIPVLSPKGGEDKDGVIIGSINNSLFNSVQTNLIIATTVNAVKKDETSGVFTFTDISTEAVSEVDDSFIPFGSDAEFSALDSLFLTNDVDVQEFFFNITTPGVWAGDGFELFDSTDGLSANRQLTGIIDSTDGFRAAAGVHKIAWDIPLIPRVAWSPSIGNVASRKWIVIRPKNLTGVTTAPKLRRMYIKNNPDLSDHLDTTDVVNTDVDDGVWPVFGAVTAFFTAGEILYLGLPFLSRGVDVTVHRKLVPIIVPAWEYLSKDTIWRPLTNVVDPSENFNNGPVTLGQTPEKHEIRWDVPEDWENIFIVLTPNEAVRAFWVRRRTLSATPEEPFLIPLVRARVRAFGTANSTGLAFKEATELCNITFSAGIPPNTDCTIQLSNINTGQTVSYVHPAGVVFSGELPGQRIVLSPPLRIGVGDSLLVAHLAGGTIRDLELHIT